MRGRFSFRFKNGDAIPAFAGRLLAQVINALDIQIVEVARLDALQIHQCNFRLIPVLRTVGTQGLIPQLDLVHILARDLALLGS